MTLQQALSDIFGILVTPLGGDDAAAPESLARLRDLMAGWGRA